MTWTAPHSWVTDEQITSSLLNETRDNLLAIVHPYDYAPSDVDVTNTVTETSLYSKVITGGDLGANGMLRLTLLGDFLYNNSTADVLTLRVKWGGSTVLTPFSNTLSSSTSGSRFAHELVLYVANRAATNSQFIYATFMAGRPSGATNHGFSTQPVTTAIDTTSDQTLQVTAQWTAASSSLSWRKRLAVLHLGQN